MENYSQQWTERGLCLLGTEIPDLCRALAPQCLAEAGPDLKTLADRGAPWSLGKASRGLKFWRPSVELAKSPVIVCGPCSSTFKVLEYLDKNGLLADFSAVVGISQWAGRGQRCRAWLSPPGNLYVAWKWPPPPKAAAAFIPLIAALGIAQALESCGLAVSFKWPNDILIHGRKAGGILVLSAGDAPTIGIGMNLAWAPPDNEMRAEHAPMATTLQNHGLFLDPIALWNAMAGPIKSLLDKAGEPGWQPDLIEQVEKRLAWIGQTVMILASGKLENPTRGVVLGLAGDGALLVSIQGKTQVIYSASLTLADND